MDQRSWGMTVGRSLAFRAACARGSRAAGQQQHHHQQQQQPDSQALERLEQANLAPSRRVMQGRVVVEHMASPWPAMARATREGPPT